MISKKIFIVGYGAIGKVLAVLLKEQKKQVVVIRGSKEEIDPYKEDIKVELNNGLIVSRTLSIYSLNHFKVLDGIILLTNKSYGNKRLASLLNEKHSNTPVVILQNGLGIEDHFVEKGFTALYRCVLFATSELISGNRLSFRPVTASPVGVIRGDVQQLKSIVKEISTDRFPFIAEKDIQPIIWRKAIVNSVFNSICPILEIDNGIFHRRREALELAEMVVQECLPVAKEYGVALEFEDIMNSIQLISRSSDGQLISTLQDLRKKRPTEIDTLNYEFGRLARKIDQNNHLRVTELLGKLVKIKSDLLKK